jgi:hypothetical protein
MTKNVGRKLLKRRDFRASGLVLYSRPAEERPTGLHQEWPLSIHWVHLSLPPVVVDILVGVLFMSSGLLLRRLDRFSPESGAP